MDKKHGNKLYRNLIPYVNTISSTTLIHTLHMPENKEDITKFYEKYHFNTNITQCTHK